MKRFIVTLLFGALFMLCSNVSYATDVGKIEKAKTELSCDNFCADVDFTLESASLDYSMQGYRYGDYSYSRCEVPFFEVFSFEFAPFKDPQESSDRTICYRGEHEFSWCRRA